MLKKDNILILLLVVVAFAAGYFYFKSQNLEGAKGQVQTADSENQAKIKKPDPKEHWNGKTNVRYVIVEYSDLECPYCKSVHPNLNKLTNVYSGKIAWVFRHFPLPSHSRAQKSAEATECATEQKGNDGFWKMTNLLFEKMPEVNITDLPVYAKEIGLDADKMKACLDSNKYEKRVKDSLEEGSAAGVNSTPTSILYDLKTGKTQSVIGALPYEDLKKSLDEFISENK